MLIANVKFLLVSSKSPKMPPSKLEFHVPTQSRPNVACNWIVRGAGRDGATAGLKKQHSIPDIVRDVLLMDSKVLLATG